PTGSWCYPDQGDPLYCYAALYQNETGDCPGHFDLANDQTSYDTDPLQAGGTYFVQVSVANQCLGQGNCPDTTGTGVSYNPLYYSNVVQIVDNPPSATTTTVPAATTTVPLTTTTVPAETTTSTPAPTAASTRVGRAQDLHGVVEVRRQGGTWVPLTNNQVLYGDEEVQTGQNGSMNVTLPGGSIIELGYNSSMQLDQLAYHPPVQVVDMSLFGGVLQYLTGKLKCIQSTGRLCSEVVHTRTVAVAVRGTDLCVRYDAKHELFTLDLHQGLASAYVNATKRTILMSAGHRLTVNARGTARVSALTTAQWSADLQSM
ncbi:MAG TPA: FecR domain-containing protein, partial [Acidimicrobiales bacterium]|nr:FecR domain-containing protein [Acidimicrobiales bacterium]